jgi:hypothetical protein
LKKLFNNIQPVLIVVLIVVIILQRSCSGPSVNLNLPNNNTLTEGAVITKIETKWDTLTLDSLVYVPKWNTKIEYQTAYETIIQDIDTLSILKDYYSKYFYSDTIDLDSFGNIVINDTITKNSIITRKIKPTLYIPTTTITRDSLITKRELYYGLGLVANKQQFSYMGGELLYRTRRKHIYGVGVGINNELQPVFSGRIMWKIGK